MRYSMLVYITKMSRTLLEATQYLRTGPERQVAEELLLSGAQMLDQIRQVLEDHKEDLRSGLPLDTLSKIEQGWQEQSEGLETALERLVGCLPEQVRYQVRAVFFTGLGSTWDAMESVYEYMRGDPRFDPVVVLIPVFRQVQQDGETKQEVTYTDYLTPMGIPFLEYTQYNIEGDYPDLAFTNQPYELTIPEQFWPETIAKYTRLIYLPYFLPALVLKEHKQALCQLPVYRYAWKTIGFSERHFQFYCKYALNGGSNMLVTGLPKLDPIVRIAQEPCSIPDRWKAPLKERKVILWNTWYDYQLSSISHFEAIIQWIKSHEDCALIWRPHPMTDTVTKLYSPAEIYTKFQQYKKIVYETPNAIFDEEPSFYAAFSCSAAQISDYSSMMCQYLPLDKPLLWIKNDEVIRELDGQQKKFFIDSSWMENALTDDDITGFLDRVRQGVDKNADVRQEIFHRDIPFADGHCGKRVCENLWEAIHREDFG